MIPADQVDGRLCVSLRWCNLTRHRQAVTSV